MRSDPLPAFGGEKARRLFWAAKNGGIVKVADDGFTWIFEKIPKTMIRDGVIIPAPKFLEMATATLELSREDVFSVDDNTIRQVAQKIAGFDVKIARNDARGLEHADQ